MPRQTGLVLKQGKEKPLLQRHRWIYSGAVASLPPVSAGPIVPVEASDGRRLGIAALSRGRSIAAHVLAFGDESLETALRSSIRSAAALRRRYIDASHTNAYRLIHAEGDGIPGLIVDQYRDVLVMQISHPALESIRGLIVSLLQEEIGPASIYEKSTSFLRKKEGLQEIQALRWGEPVDRVEILERGLSYIVDPGRGQKTGWFLDQREMRDLVRGAAAGRRVLNAFAYTGGFSVSALAGGAVSVDSVEISARCGPLVEEHIALNGLDASRHRFLCRDAFDFLEIEDLPYDLVILDPPAFVKKREDIAAAFRAYKEINRLAMSKMPPGSMLATCSCSYHMGEELFRQVVFRAALEAGRNVRILSSHRQAWDHPVSVYHPESVYLKSLILDVE